MMKPNKISPNVDKQALWKTIYEDMLKEILGFGKVKSQYKHRIGKRFWNVFSTILCMPTCCAPCVAWDCACCCLSVCCDNHRSWGCTLEAVGKVCSDTFEDTRKTQLRDISYSDIHFFTMDAVCKAYVQAYDAQIAIGTTESARKANVIRSTVFDTLRCYGPGFNFINLQDDGSIDTIRKLMEKLPDMYNTQRHRFNAFL